MALGRMSFFGASLKKSAGGWEGKKAVRHAERKNSHTHTKKKHGIGAIFIRTEEQDQQQQDEKKRKAVQTPARIRAPLLAVRECLFLILSLLTFSG